VTPLARANLDSNPIFKRERERGGGGGEQAYQYAKPMVMQVILTKTLFTIGKSKGVGGTTVTMNG
jgi:hypothetical protein